MNSEDFLFKANLGNLMQHWVLCEALDGMRRSFKATKSHLFYFDAHSMAPLSRPDNSSTYSRPLFMSVQSQLPGRKSIYEEAWYELQKKTEGYYPSSALFIHHLWKARWNRRLTPLLCEIDQSKSESIGDWLTTNGYDQSCSHNGDWRDSILEIPEFLADAMLFSFDPFRLEVNQVQRWAPGVMYPNDFDYLLLIKFSQLPVVIQVSTYSADNSNPHSKVQEMVLGKLRTLGFNDHVAMISDGNMMSLLSWKPGDLSRYFTGMPQRFSNWLRHVKK